MADGVRELVSRLQLTGFSRLCARSWIPSSLTREEQIARLVAQYSQAVDRLLDVLRRSDLIEVLASLRIPVGERVVELINLWSASKSALQRAVRAVFVDGWLPSAEGDSPADPVSTRFFDRVAADAGGAAPIADSTSIDRASDGGLPVFEQIVGRAAPETGALQPFQLEAIRRLREHFISSDHRAAPLAARRGLLCLPTGGGKTRTALEFLLKHFIGRQRVLWIAHRLELLDQVHHELRSLGAQLPEGTSFSISRVQGSDRDLRGDVVIASNATLLQQRSSRSALDSPSMPLGIVVFDEGHHAVAEQTWRYLEQLMGSDVHLLSLTATPFRSERGGTEKLRALLGDVVHEQTFRSLVKEGFLAEPLFVRQVLRSTAAFSLSAMEQKALERAEDFSSETLRRIAGTPGRDKEIVEHWQQQRNEFGKTIVFACDIDHAERLARRFQEIAPAMAIHSGLSRDDRQQRLQWFRAQTQPCVLVNVGILTEGTNVPDVRCVLVARPTMSKALFHQMIGRGSRGPKTVPGKKHFTVIDCVDGYEHLGAQLAGAGLAAEFRDDGALDDDGEADVRDATVSSSRGGSAAVVRPTPSVTAEGDVWTASLAATYAWHRDAGRAIDDLVPVEELSCNAASGRISVPLFDSVLPVVATSLDLLQTAISLQRWTDAHERRSSLDAYGAIRPTQWSRIVAHAQASGRLPVQCGVRAFAEHTSVVAKDAVEPLLALLNRCEAVAEGARRAEVEAALVVHPALAVFASASALEATVVELLEDRRARAPSVEQPAAAASDSGGVVQAFVVLAGAVARADGAWIEAEYSVTSKAVEQQFQQSIATRFDDIHTVASDEESLGAALRELGAALSWEARSVLFDWLCRVAIADEQLHREEERVLLALGAALGLSQDDVDRRIGWTLDRDPNAVGARADGRIACSVCSSVMVADAVFCGTCGAALHGGAVDDESCPCPACGTRMPSDAAFCGACRASMRPPPVVAVVDVQSGAQPDWAAGARAEEFVLSLLEPLVERKSATVRRRVRARVAGEDRPGETDIEITRARAPDAGDRRCWDLHIEVKHLKSPTTGAVYWSQREVEKAKRLREQRVAYYVVVAVPREDATRFDLYWSTDPLDDLLRDTARSLIRTDTLSVELNASDGWRVEKWMPGPPTSAYSFQIRLGRGGLERWSHDSATQIAPVEAWFEEQERSSVSS